MQRRSKSIEDAKLASTFESLRKDLLAEQCSEHLDRTLAFWARGNDKGLPIALLDRTLRELLETPFAELAKTPGIGEKKIRTLVKLLTRAASESPSDSLDHIDEAPLGDESSQFDPGQVSDAQWTQWCAKVRRFGLQSETLGRLAPTLREVPTVIWDTQLGTYLDYGLNELQALRNHGEKRVGVVLSVFHDLDGMLGDLTGSHLQLRLLPQFVPTVESWIDRCYAESAMPSVPEIRANLSGPMLAQARKDLGSTVAGLAAARLGGAEAPKTVQQLAHEADLTRARVYQLIDECADMMRVRWPEGGPMLRRLSDQLALTRAEHTGDDDDAWMHFQMCVDLFYPPAEKQPSRAADSRPATAEVVSAG